MNRRFQTLACALSFIAQPGFGALPGTESPGATRGVYFSEKSYQPAPLPRFAEIRDRLPSPLFEERPEWVSMYWKSWELAFKNFHEPAPGSGYVSQFIDAAFNENIFLWDTCFMTMFCNGAHPLVPGIASLDNFYAKQHEDGEICREINRSTGRDYAPWVNREGRQLFSRWGWTGAGNEPVVYQGRPAPQPPPELTLDALNHPVLAWAELESYRVTGDRERLGRVYEPLVRYYRALQKYLRQGNGLYMTDWASMDNSPRNAFLKGGGGAIDTSSQMALFGRNLATIAKSLGKAPEAAGFAREADELGAAINALMWDPARRFYFDLTIEGKCAPVKTVAGFWPLLAGVASAAQADDLARELENPATFNRWHGVPTLAADQAGYDPAGGYWRGAVWAPTTTMVIRGLERCGRSALARKIALNHLAVMGEVFQKTGTVWENYAPDAPAPGRPARPDFVGWSGIGPILYLLEFAVGLKADAASNTLVWEVASDKPLGAERFRFNGHVVSLKAEPTGGERRSLKLSVTADGPFKLLIRHGGREEAYPIAKGQHALSFARLDRR